MAEIASIFVSPIVSKLTETVATLINEELAAIKGAKKELEKLSSNLITIAAVLEDAEKKQMDAACGRSLKVWLSKLKNIAFDVEDILDTFATEAHLSKDRRMVSG
ncbi:putative disease resistance protein RGA4 [Gossypium arboreum]|uniref:putative disease resistance protein RGA4 n=1 Tax=Gossypium arboreum TaxID=29729 RepID=UPI0022F1DD08|nr:putative disease resistance protein RGA4 [Gossypium arboreum]XP_052878561.1 putative disease resistance protein RGA4 [Gossypium arboreum]